VTLEDKRFEGVFETSIDVQVSLMRIELCQKRPAGEASEKR
jgi:hypothetical protein